MPAAYIEMLDDSGAVTDECDAVTVDESLFDSRMVCENIITDLEPRDHSTVIVSWVSSSGMEYHLCSSCVEDDDYVRLVGDETAWERPETDPCERGTVGCSVRHNSDSECETW